MCALMSITSLCAQDPSRPASSSLLACFRWPKWRRRVRVVLLEYASAVRLPRLVPTAEYHS
eukprot:3599145-Rhodomonas_salina.1